MHNIRAQHAVAKSLDKFCPKQDSKKWLLEVLLSDV